MGLSEEEVINLKKRYGKLLSVPYKGIEYIFRPIIFAEYDELELHKEWSSADTEDALAATAIVFPKDIDSDRLPAGLVSSIADEILNVSGFGDPKPLIDIMAQCRAKTNDARTLMYAMVIAMMPAYKEEDLDQLTFPQLAAKVALAEQIAAVHQAVAGGGEVKIDLVDPEEEAQRHEMKKQHRASSKAPGQAGLDDPIARRLAQALQ